MRCDIGWTNDWAGVARWPPFLAVQNVLAQVCAEALWSVSATDLRRDLHWLPINHCIIYKLSVLIYKALHTVQPCYLAELIELYRPSRVLQSTLTSLLFLPVLSLLLPLELFVYLCLIIGTLFPCISTHLIVWVLSNLQGAAKIWPTAKNVITW